MTDRPDWVRALLCRELTATEYRVWSYLSWRQGGNGHAWPSLATIAADLGLTIQGARTITRRLAAKGWLRIHAAGAVGRGHSIRYGLSIPDEKVNGDTPFLVGEKVNGDAPFEREKVNGHSEKRSTAVDPNTSHEHRQEKSTSVPSIRFDREAGRFTGIDDGRLGTWGRAYPGIDVVAEIRKAAAWATANPHKAKKRWEAFLVNWLSRAEKDLRNGARQHRTHRPSFAGQVSTVGEVVEI